MAGNRQKQFVRHRRVERGDSRPAGMDQRHRNRPVRKTREIGACAIDRIDHPDLGFGQPRRIVLGLLGQPSHIADGREPFPQQRIDGEIGLADRRGLVLDPAFDLAAKCLQRERAAFAHRGGETIAHIRAIAVGAIAVGITGRQR